MVINLEEKSPLMGAVLGLRFLVFAKSVIIHVLSLANVINYYNCILKGTKLHLQ